MRLPNHESDKRLLVYGISCKFDYLRSFIPAVTSVSLFHSVVAHVRLPDTWQRFDTQVLKRARDGHMTQGLRASVPQQW